MNFKIPYNETIKVRNDDKTLIFDPKEDMTPYESAKICQMFCVALTSSFDCIKFIDAYKLHRHFKEEENV